jgi:gamma-glutamylcyclotransferase (GGCT)/AIG2-like uncharacterized protein YtfP
MTPLFVYGTLTSAAPQGALLAGYRRTPATVRGRLYDLPAGYPAVTLGGDGIVHGELVETPEDGKLLVLDAYEGVPEGLYRRVLAEVSVGLRRVQAWIYVMDAPEARGGRLVPTGRWKVRRLR